MQKNKNIIGVITLTAMIIGIIGLFLPQKVNGAIAVSSSESTITVSPVSVPADGSTTSLIIVRALSARTAMGSLTVPITSISVVSSRAEDVVTFGLCLTCSSNEKHYTIKSETAGMAQITATVNGIALVNRPTITFTTPPVSLIPVSSILSSISSSPTSISADGISFSAITVNVRNTANENYPRKTVALSSSRGSAVDTIETVLGTTDASGIAIFRVRSGTAGLATFTARVGLVTVIDTATVNFVSPIVALPDPTDESGSGSSASESSESSSTGSGSETSSIPIAPIVLNFGDLFKENQSTAVYYYARNGKRYVFPTQAVYFSWYNNFTNIKTATRAQIMAIPLGGNVLTRPGKYLAQFVSMDTPFRVMDPKVYVLAQDGQLRWLRNSATAILIYGANWEQQIIAVPEIYKPNYGINGIDVVAASDYSRADLESAIRSIDDIIAR